MSEIIYFTFEFLAWETTTIPSDIREYMAQAHTIISSDFKALIADCASARSAAHRARTVELSKWFEEILSAIPSAVADTIILQFMSMQLPGVYTVYDEVIFNKLIGDFTPILLDAGFEVMQLNPPGIRVTWRDRD